jgi:carboxymethylenebutenolidase
MYAHFGELDDAKGFSDVAAAKNLETKAKEAKINFEMKIWPGTLNYKIKTTF